jgi:hypothetical protein
MLLDAMGAPRGSSDASGAKRPRGPGSPPTMQLGRLDWLLAGSTVALGIALIAAPLALVPRLSSIYSLQGAVADAPALARWMLSPWLPGLMGVGPVAVAISCTVTAMRPRRRKVVLALALVAAVIATAMYVKGLMAPLTGIAGAAV